MGAPDFLTAVEHDYSGQGFSGTGNAGTGVIGTPALGNRPGDLPLVVVEVVDAGPPWGRAIDDQAVDIARLAEVALWVLRLDCEVMAALGQWGAGSEAPVALVVGDGFPQLAITILDQNAITRPGRALQGWAVVIGCL